MLWNEHWQFIYRAFHKYLYSVQSLDHLDLLHGLLANLHEKKSRSALQPRPLGHKPHVGPGWPVMSIPMSVPSCPHHPHHGRPPPAPLPATRLWLPSWAQFHGDGGESFCSKPFSPSGFADASTRAQVQQGGPGHNTSSSWFISVFKTHFHNQHSVLKERAWHLIEA